MTENVLYYGDNLDVLRRHIKDETVDLVYLDPPFKSDQSYNVLFAAKDGTEASAQIQAFEDTWQWDEAAARAYEEEVEKGGTVSSVLRAFREFLGTNDMLAYLAMMAPRLVELRRVLKNSGSLFLHCDPTASHYLKLLLDAVFSPENFANEIIWQRSTGKALMSRRLPSNHDVLLTYHKSDEARWNSDAMFIAYDPEMLDEKTASKYTHTDSDGRVYRLDSLINPNPDRPNLTYEFLGVTRVWRWTRDRMQKAYRDGLVVQTKPGTVPQLKRYLDEQRGRPLGDVWSDIPPLNSQAQERLGYPTQKPEALVDRIIRLGCPPAGVVLDPFCGCGTTIASAQRLGRNWIGIDITHLAIALIKARLQTAFGDRVAYKVIGEPTTIEDAKVLAESEPYQFQWWALGLVGARGVEKKGADKGIDGRLFWHEGDSKTRQLIISVKAGGVHRSQVHELRGVVEREKAEIGVLLSFEEPTKPMREEAASAGFHTSPWGKHPRIQLLTVDDLLHGKGIDYPRTAGVNITLKAAPKIVAEDSELLHLPLGYPAKKVAEPASDYSVSSQPKSAKKKKKK